MRFGLAAAVIFIILCTISFTESRRGSMSDTPADSNRVDDSPFVRQAIQKLWEERRRMGYTPLVQMRIPGMSSELDFYFKDESRARTGNLKHRFAWCLFMWALLEGHVSRNTTIFEASSGNTATSEAYFAQLIGVPFVAVIPTTTDQQKIDKIQKYGGKVHKADIAKQFIVAEEEAEKYVPIVQIACWSRNSHELTDIQKTLSSQEVTQQTSKQLVVATDLIDFVSVWWILYESVCQCRKKPFVAKLNDLRISEEYHESASNDKESVNVFHEVLQQLKTVDRSMRPNYPEYFVHSAGTGGTISSIGRYVRKYGGNTKVVMSDTQYSIYYDYVINQQFGNESGAAYWVAPGMAGTGFGYSGPAILGVTTSLQPSVIDRALKVPDLASTAAMHVLKKLGINGGTSTGLNSTSVKKKNPNMRFRIVSILADSSDLYENTYFNKTWIADKFKPHGGLVTFKCWKGVIERSYRLGSDPLHSGDRKCKPEPPGANSRVCDGGECN
ncbi:hypothetical protein M3Y94_00482600 [Aphelenchoides besseyi]|nr:hypothetical protein M3Y94_00482600 [Aphelenchoides besseyi]